MAKKEKSKAIVRYFAFSENEKGEENVGSDSYFLCDGRWNLFTCIVKAKEYYQSLYPKGRHFAFKIYTGTILNATPITGSYRVYGKND